MKFSASTLVLSTLAIGQATAATMHGKAHNHAARHSEQIRSQNEARELSKRLDLSVLSDLATNKLKGMGISCTGNTQTAAIPGSTAPWVGTGGSITNEVFCQDDQECTLVVWGSAGSWVAAVTPQLTVSIPKNSSKTISFPNGWSGAWAPVYANTTMSQWGQIFETWGEGTINHPWTTFDVSREVNMNGRNMRIVTPQCTTDMQKCSFQCVNGQNSCMKAGDYDLLNCDVATQKGANKGNYGGGASGGCSGLKDGDKIQTYLSYKS